MKSQLLTTLAAATLGVALPAANAAPLSLGGSLGSARVNEGDFEGSDTGFKAFIESHGQLLGGEIQYVDFGKMSRDSNSINGPGTIEPAVWAPSVSLGIPLGGVRLQGKAGIAFPEVDGENIGDEYKDNEGFYGVGLRAGGNMPLGFRIEYERFRLGGQDLDLASAGLELRFGGGTTGASSTRATSTTTTTTTTQQQDTDSETVP